MSETLQDLVDAMGERANDLRRAPYEIVVTEPLRNEPDAINMKMLLGYTRMRNTPAAGANENVLIESLDDEGMPSMRHNVWIHLYPPQTLNSHPEVHFHEYASDGTHIARLDGENISRVLFETAKAFTSPTARKWSKSKLVALAKYYFLRRLAETDDMDDDQQFLRMPISKTFKEDLTAVCRDLKEAAETENIIVVEKRSKRRHTDLLFVAEDESDSSDEDITKEESLSSAATISGIPGPDVDSQPDTMKSLLELSRDECRIASDADKIKNDISALEDRRDTLVKEEADRQKRMADMLDGMTAGAAFTLGRQVEREMASKRRRVK